MTRYRLIALLAAVAVIVFAAASCDNNDFTKQSATALRVSQGTWTTFQKQAAQLYIDGKITEEQWQTFRAVDRRYTASHNAAVEALKIYSQVRAKGEDASWAQHAVTVALSNLLGILREGEDLIAAWQ